MDYSSSFSGGCVEWSVVVNGTRYFGHLRQERRFVSKLEDVDDSVGSSPSETMKERNRRLLIRDRLVQAGLDKNWYAAARHSRKLSMDH